MTAAQRLQREKKEKYYLMHIDEELAKMKGSKKKIGTPLFREMLMDAYRRGVSSLG